MERWGGGLGGRGCMGVLQGSLLLVMGGGASSWGFFFCGISLLGFHGGEGK